MFQNFGMTHAIDIKLRMEEKKAREGSSTFSASAAFRVQTSGTRAEELHPFTSCLWDKFPYYPTPHLMEIGE